MVRCICCVYLIVLTLLFPSALRAEVTADEVNNAIDRGVAYLESQQHPRQGNWTEQPGYAAGMTALCTLALLESGVDPGDEDIQRALDYLRNLDMPQRTYGVALQTMAFCAAEPEKDMLLILRNARYIESMQRNEGPMKGAWGYDHRQGGGDHSNTQFAMLALYEADRASLRVTGEAIVHPQTWRLAAQHWIDTDQNGAWGYQVGGQVSGSMTCAGIASLVMATSRYSVDATVERGGQVRCCGEGQQNDPLMNESYATIELGREWLGRHFTTDRNPGGHSYRLYYLYAAERVGRMTGQRFFGSHDWYRKMAEALVEDQDRFTGSWTANGVERNPTLGTALALLALSKGRRPVVISKLERPGAANDWNLHKSDVQNLTRYVESRWEMRLSWQTIKIDTASVQDLLQTPVLYITGRDSLDLTAEQKENLKKYVEQGGFIFASASAGGEFDAAFRELMEEIFPDSQLRKLPPDHAVWYAEEPLDMQPLPEVWGLDACCRTSVVYVPTEPFDLSCYLELAHEGGFEDYPEYVQDQIQGMRGLAANILAYATNRQLHDKLDIPLYLEDDGAETPARGTLFVAKIMHGGGGDDAPAALSNMLRELAAHSEQRVSTERRLLQPDNEDLADYPLLFMHGRRNFQFSPVEVSQLRDYIEHGGVLFSDAICASEEYGTSFRGLVREMFPEGRLQRIPPDHALFTDAFRGFDLETVMLRDPEARQRDDPLHTRLRRISPVLEGLEIDGRYVIIFSPYDLSCAMEAGVSLDCKGYDKDDAARLATNIILYSLQQ